MDLTQFVTVQLPTLLVAVIGVPLVIAAYIVGFEWIVRRLPDEVQPKVRPWVWVGPSLGFVTIFLVVPLVLTVYYSLLDRKGGSFVGIANYAAVLSDPAVLITIRNNLYWLFLYTFFVLVFGVLMAVLADRVPYETPVKSLIFMPMAISFVAMSVIWKFMYSYQPPGSPQTGTLNYLLTSLLHTDPITWVQDIRVNNFALIGVAIWGWVGFAMVILSAALKGIPGDLLEAARVDGAGEVTIFRRVIFPLLMPTITVVATTLVIFALKAFDIVYVMTNGNFDTNILAVKMYQEYFVSADPGRSGAIAVILLVAVVPVLFFNLSQFRAQEARR